MQNARLDEAQAGIKIARRIINNFRYADDITLMAESKLKILLMKVQEESDKVGLHSTFRKLRSWHPAPSFMENRWGKNGSSDRFYFGGAPKSLQMVKLKDVCFLEENL